MFLCVESKRQSLALAHTHLSSITVDGHFEFGDRAGHFFGIGTAQGLRKRGLDTPAWVYVPRFPLHTYGLLARLQMFIALSDHGFHALCLLLQGGNLLLIERAGGKFEPLLHGSAQRYLA